ncbi:MAG TPA: 3-deoxy-7-phosphoheptulonate synthase class II, partial [Protaetiibacter sp.]|nr:3-deoxy-7-phosphoheptulonate synthase class II [Protaetiibacter sp.]
MVDPSEPVVQADPDVIAGLDYWRELPIKQQPDWPDPDAVAAASAQIASMPPLVFAGEIDILRDRLARAARGESFLLQGGDCAETFAGATADQIRNRVKTILQMAVVLTYGASMPIVKMGRMAGQFAKPRSSDFETRGDVTLPAYRGDIVNGYDFTPESRQADPARLVQGYHTAASTLNLIRAFTQGGFADLRQVHSWNKGFAANPANQRYEGLAKEIDRAIRFMEAAGADFDELKRVEFYTSHEGLLMDYERPMTRIDSRNGTPVNTSAHFLWIGERTRDLDGAHIDYFSRIRNPIGVKLGPSTDASTMEKLIDKLDPEREPGRLTFITRMGAGKIRDALPPLLEAIKGMDATPLWVTDPMHGNGITTPTGYKTRRFDDVVDEVRGFFEAHRAAGTHPGGLHVELTG